MTRNLPLLVAAGTLFSIATMHTALGEWKGRRLVRRMVESGTFDARDPADVLSMRIIRLAWHLTSLAWGGIAVVLADASFVAPTRLGFGVIRVLATVFACHAVLSLIISRGKHPSCYLFAVVAALLLIGDAP
jgi:hypothetical protein